MEEIKWVLNRYGKWIVIIVVVIMSSLILEHKSDKEKEKKVSGTVSQTKKEVEISSYLIELICIIYWIFVHG